jgi:hypothetical protein
MVLTVGTLACAALQGTPVRQSLVMMQALPAPDATPVNFMQQPCLPVSAAALSPSAPASVAGSARAAGPNKYYSPLNTNKGQGSVVAQLLEMRSSLHYGSDNGGDTHSVAASDQQAPRDKNVAVASQVSAAAHSGVGPCWQSTNWLCHCPATV